MAKRPRVLALVALACAANWASASAIYAATPETVGTCTLTAVTSVGYRAGESGSVIEYANGRWQVDYNFIPGIHNSRRDDDVLLCLTAIPTDCPPGDGRGRTYKGTNLRTLESWSALDSEHSCGGA